MPRNDTSQHYQDVQYLPTSMASGVPLVVNPYQWNVLAWMFGDEKVEIEVKFWFERHNIPNDVDNLLKFVLDALQKAGIIDNDNQVVKVCMMKATGEENKIDLKVFRHFLVNPSEYVSDGIVVFKN